MRMRNLDDVARAAVMVQAQLSRQDIGATHQRALLTGVLTALNWIQGHHVPALQRIVDGQDVIADDEARLAAPTPAQRPGRRIVTG